MSFYLPENFSYEIGQFIERPNRFVAYVNLKSEIVRCHVPDPGRLKELLIPKRNVLLRIPKDKSNYKTFGAVVGIQLPTEKWISLDSQLANRFIKNEWKNLPIFKDYETIKPEFQINKSSRIDFLLKTSNSGVKPALIEVKTVTLHFPELSGIGLFPDAPTKRGSKHIKELLEAKSNGYRSIIIFVSPRDDINEIRPNFHTDPIFTENLIKASNLGVELYAYRCTFDLKGIKFDSLIPVNLEK
ncbi:MAG: DNA/RNA nuclease SfsA [Candidatus Hodarchaeales archaeon]|jgi:sugar fermentation stimulation protein A